MPKRKKASMSNTARRTAAMDAVPIKLPIVKKERKEEKLYLTVQYERTRWQQFLGADVYCDRTFGLDTYGQRVYDSCDGQRRVKHIVKRFAKQTQVSQAEAEVAVTKFIKTLISKGLIAMKMEKPFK